MTYRFKVTILGGAYLYSGKVVRVLDVPGSFTLERLCIAILDSVDFSYDHLYEFTIHGQTYEAGPFGEGKRCNVKLFQLGLRKEDTFELLYDYGDDWLFEIKVLEIRDSSRKGAVVISSEGEVSQYPADEDWDDEDDEDWDDEDDEDWDDEDDEDWDDEAGSSLMDEYDYTPPDELFETAFRYKKTKIWKWISGEDLYAMRFSDGTIGYISIMGQEGDHCALSVYPGYDGFASYCSIENRDPNGPVCEEVELITGQNCIQVIFDNQEYLIDQEIENARNYAAKHGIRFSGKNAFPHFSRFLPGKFPWKLRNETEEQYLLEAMEAAISLSDTLKKKRIRELGFSRFKPSVTEVPYMICEDGEWKLSGMCPLPEIKPPVFDTPHVDMIKLQRIKKMKAKGTLEGRIIMYPQPVSSPDGPYYPYLFLSLYKEKDYAVRPQLVPNLSVESIDTLAESLLDALIDMTWKPSKMMVEDERSFAFLKPIADGMGAKLTIERELDALDLFLDQFLSDMTEGNQASMQENASMFEETLVMLEAICDAPDSAVKNMPKEVSDSIRMLLESGMVPPELAQKVRKKLSL